MRSDSCGIFIAFPVGKFSRVRDEGHFAGHSGKLDCFTRGQGYPLDSYVGGAPMMRKTFALSGMLAASTAPAAAGSPPVPPLCKEKPIKFDRWDPTGKLFVKGGHAPLVAVIEGNVAGRGKGSLAAREHAATARGWGPGSAHRARHMQELGHDPKPYKGKDKGDGDGSARRWYNDKGVKGKGKHTDTGKARKGK